MPDNFSAQFLAAFAFTVGQEGGYTNNPLDAGNWTGGACGVGQCNGTNFGISAASYPAVDIANLTAEQAQLIYSQSYWAPIQGDKLPLKLAMVGFDAAVNSGVGKSVKWLQTACNTVAGSRLTIDGNLGPLTLAALLAKSPEPIAQEALVQRLMFLTSLQSWPNFGLGWGRRVLALLAAIA